MIRNIVAVRLRPDHDPAAIDTIIEGFRSLDCPGTVSYTIGRDLGLREGNWSFAIVADFVDVDAYRGYDLDEEHNRWRGELGPYAETTARVQFELPD
jgi:hypothetical protein